MLISENITVFFCSSHWAMGWLQFHISVTAIFACLFCHTFCVCIFFPLLIRTVILFSLIVVWLLIQITQSFIFPLLTLGSLLYGICVFLHICASCLWMTRLQCVYLWMCSISVSRSPSKYTKAKKLHKNSYCWNRAFIFCFVNRKVSKAW